MPHGSGYQTRRPQARPRRAQQAKQRRHQKARDHLQREQARAQRDVHALEPALVDLGLSETLVVEVEWRLRALGKLLGKIFGVMFPTLCGCRTTDELTRVRGWDKHVPGRILGALPKQQWVRPLPHRGPDLLATLWHHVADKSPATRSRWQWTWVGDARVFNTSRQQLGLVGPWYRGQEHRVRRGIDGLRLGVVIGEGKLVIPVDCTGRRPDPLGPGRPGRDTLTWVQVMLDRTWAALHQLGLRLPPPLMVADRWFGDSKVMAHVASHLQGRWLVEGQRPYVFHLGDGRRITGQDLRTCTHGPGRESSQVPRVR